MRVSPEWLALREPADAAARSGELAARLARRVRGPLVIHDLGGGTGSMGRWLAPRLPGPQRWVVHDRDPDLLRLADGVETRESDVTRLTPEDLAGASLVTASALLDLLTADELDRMLAACEGLPLLLALTVTGRVTLDPPDPLDEQIGEAFNDHQRRAGRLGPDAVDAIVPRPRRADTCERAASPWRLGPADAALTAEWLRGWVGAAHEQDPSLDADAYLERRLAQRLSVTVGHADVLVLP
jgi:hypothetical protein